MGLLLVTAHRERENGSSFIHCVSHACINTLRRKRVGKLLPLTSQMEWPCKSLKSCGGTIPLNISQKWYTLRLICYQKCPEIQIVWLSFFLGRMDVPLSFGLMVPVCKTFWCVAVALIASDFLVNHGENGSYLSCQFSPFFPQKKECMSLFI